MVKIALEGLPIDQDVFDVRLLLVGLTRVAYDHQLLFTHHLVIKEVAQWEAIGYPILFVSFLLPFKHVLTREGDECKLLLLWLVLEV